MNEFKHIISLGFDCSVARELEKNGLRDSSSPFDWMTTAELEKVIRLIDNNFDSFLDFDSLYQDKKLKNVYTNIKYNISFFHDFNKYESLSTQILEVRNKYERRVKRFYNNIKEPTLFVRFINRTSELAYIEKNITNINKVLKHTNINNKIIFISSDRFDSQIIKLYKIESINNEYYINDIIKRNKELNSNFEKNLYYSPEKRKINSNIYKNKMKFNFSKRIYNKIKREYNKIKRPSHFKEYIHYNQL